METTLYLVLLTIIVIVHGIVSYYMVKNLRLDIAIKEGKYVKKFARRIKEILYVL